MSLYPVWASYETWLDQPVEGVGRRALVVVNVHGRLALCGPSVPGECSEAAVTALERRFAEKGAPDAAQAESSKVFISKAVSKPCARRGMTLLHSPIRRPSYNGPCGVGPRWANAMTMAAPRARCIEGSLCHSDLGPAVNQKGRRGPRGSKSRSVPWECWTSIDFW